MPLTELVLNSVSKCQCWSYGFQKRESSNFRRHFWLDSQIGKVAQFLTGNDTCLPPTGAWRRQVPGTWRQHPPSIPRSKRCKRIFWNSFGIFVVTRIEIA